MAEVTYENTVAFLFATENARLVSDPVSEITAS